MGSRLFVGNLTRKTTEEELGALFAQAGTVVSVEVITVGEMRSAKSFAFVDMDSPLNAQKAVGLLNGSNPFGRRPIKVNLAHKREALPAGGGWYTS